MEQGGNRTTSTVVGGLVDACQDDNVDRQQGQGQVEQDHLRPSFADLPTKHVPCEIVLQQERGQGELWELWKFY